MRNTDAPAVLWEWVLDYEAEVKSFTVIPIPRLQGRTPHEHMTGEMPDITELVQFCWYGLVYYWSQHSFPDDRECLGHFLGIAHNFESAMCYYILPYQPKTGETKVLYHSTVRNLTEEECRDPKVKAEMESLDLSINNRLGTAAIKENDEYEGVFIEDPMIYEVLADPDPANAEPIEEEALMPDIEDFESTDSYDQYILASAILPKDDGFAKALVTRQKRDLDGNIMGSHHSNPLLDTHFYEKFNFKMDRSANVRLTLLLRTFIHRQILMVTSFFFRRMSWIADKPIRPCSQKMILKVIP